MRTRASLPGLLLAAVAAACSPAAAPETDAPVLGTATAGGAGGLAGEAELVGPAGRAVALGAEFEIRLPANPTTGHRWELGTPLDETIVRLIQSRYDAEPTDVVGSGGITVFTFEAVGPGRTNVHFVYVRPWEKGVAPSREAIYAIVVE